MRQVIGLECDAAMADSARENIRRLRGRRSATLIVTADAAAADFGETTAIVLFNPFGPATVRSMLVCLPGPFHSRSFRPLTWGVWSGLAWSGWSW